MMRRSLLLGSLVSMLLVAGVARGAGVTFNARSAASGAWSDAATWEDGRMPQAGDFVQVRPGHEVVYDVQGDAPIRMIHVAGTLTFARDKSTRLEVGLLKLQRGESDIEEDGFTCAAHALVEQVDDSRGPTPVVEMGTPDAPIPAGITTTIRLVHYEGTDAQTLPAIINCGGRWDVHGAPMSRTWVKLKKQAEAGDEVIELEEAVQGWNVGDRIIITESRQRSAVSGEDRAAGKFGAEERTITKIEQAKLTLDKPLDRAHQASEDGRVEVANLSRNVVIESANPDGVRGHTMYHRHSTGGISYAEFRRLGKEGLLGKYPIHFHLVRDAMRGSGVVGASIWDSKNRFMAIHGTDYLLVRDCVGYQAVGHGYFLEDATEQYNILDRNLAVQCMRGKRLPNQVLPFDANEGAGFWWANGRNTLTRNVACENDRYGFRFEIAKIGGDAPVMGLRMPEGHIEDRDVRSVPFLRFEDNESHSEGLYSFFFGDDPAGSVYGDREHPFIARSLRAWSTHYALRPSVAFFLMEKLDIVQAAYGVYHPDYNGHVYRDVRLVAVNAEPINRGHDDESIQFGSFTYDGLVLDRCPGQPLIQLSCTAPVDGLAGHFRNMKVIPVEGRNHTVDLGIGPILADKELDKGVAYYFHESAGGEAGTAVRVVSTKFPALMNDGQAYEEIEGFTGPQVRAAQVEGVEFPTLLEPVDDLPPATLITSVRREGEKLLVRGVTQDNGEVAGVEVNGAGAKILSSHAGVADWEIKLDAAAAPGAITAHSTDAAGNIEKMAAERAIP